MYALDTINILKARLNYITKVFLHYYRAFAILLDCMKCMMVLIFIGMHVFI